jgi:NADH:ubiquinone oxidoreductase subunit 2 (subunit N)
LNTVVSLYYYARIMKAMFFRAPEHAREEGVELGGLFSPLSYKFLGVVLTLATLLFGVMPTLISLP